MTKTFSKVLAIVMAAVCLFSFTLIGSAAHAISKDQAKQIAIDAVNAKFNTSYTLADATFERIDNAEYEDDLGIWEYDCTFYVVNPEGGYIEYSVDINADTGEIVGLIEMEYEQHMDDVPTGGTGGISGFFEELKLAIARFIEFLKSLFNIA